MRTTLLLTTVLALVPAVSGARPVTAQAAASERPVRNNVISFSPFMAIAGIANLSYDRRVHSAMTIRGMAGYSAGLGIVEVNARYFPKKLAPRKLNVGVSATRWMMSDGADVCRLLSCSDASSVTSFGLDVGYTWMPGASRRFVIDTGVGGKVFTTRIFEDYPVLPFARLGVGVAF